MRDSLEYDSSPPLEKLLIDQVVLTWLSCEVTRVIYSGLAFKGGEQPEHGRYWEARLNSVEHRLHRAVESLARTRKLVRSTKAVRTAYVENQRCLEDRLALVDAESAVVSEPAPPENPSVAKLAEPEVQESPGISNTELFLQRAAEIGMPKEAIEMYLSLIEPTPSPSSERG
jgi:hypothetical protein